MKTRSDHKKEEPLRHLVGRDSVRTALGDGEVCRRIGVRAYDLYQERGGGDGHDLDDWLEAERTIVGLEATTGSRVAS